MHFGVQFSMKHVKEFTRFANRYGEYNVIQREVLRELIEGFDFQGHALLDLGCGSGQLYERIGHQTASFTAVDIAQTMCDLHPTDPSTRVICADFEAEMLYRQLAPNYDTVVSSSALQWAKDLDKTFYNIAKLTPHTLFAIFTDGTFKSIHETAQLKPLIRSAKVVEQTYDRYFRGEKYLKHYQLDFEDTLSMFRYIKKSGVSGGEMRLGVSEVRRLLTHYPHHYLEFEILFLKSGCNHSVRKSEQSPDLLSNKANS